VGRTLRSRDDGRSSVRYQSVAVRKHINLTTLYTFGTNSTRSFLIRFD